MAQGFGGFMRERGVSIVLAALLAVSAHANAATPDVTALAVTQSGKAIVLASAANTVIVRTSTGGVPVKAKLRCLELERLTGHITLPVVGSKPNLATFVWGSATQGAKWYYFSFIAVGATNKKVPEAVLVLAAATSPRGALHCKASALYAEQAFGAAVFR